MRFESTLKPLKVHFLLKVWSVLGSLECVVLDKIIEKFLADAQNLEILHFQNFKIGNFWKKRFFDMRRAP